MTDAEKVAQHIAGLSGTEEISDACARVIASWWHSGQASDGYSFVSTGAIDDPSHLWWELGGSDYTKQSYADKLALDYLGTYLLNRQDRGPVDGWSGLWL